MSICLISASKPPKYQVSGPANNASATSKISRRVALECNWGDGAHHSNQPGKSEEECHQPNFLLWKDQPWLKLDFAPAMAGWDGHYCFWPVCWSL
jgi:hypothetical protein